MWVTLTVDIVLLVLIVSVKSVSLSFDFIIERKLVNLDGFVKDALTINRNFIGPTIEATAGDNLLISVTNRAIIQEVITLHWHGVSQLGTPWADGTAFIANCPITFGSTYLYNFTVNEPGTFWYHAHIGSLNAEGTTGMIVVYSPPTSDPTALVQTTTNFGNFSYDAELRVILTDWYHPSAYTLNTMLEHNPFEWVGNGDSILINGKGESKHCSFNGTTTTLTSTSSDGSSTSVTTTCRGKREVFALERNKTYLVRVLNAAYLAFFNLAIAGHYFTVLGVDGNSYTEPVDVNSLDLSSGQRVIALLKFNHSTPNLLLNETFLLQVQTDWRGRDNTNAGIAHAYVTYGNASTITSDSVSPLVPPNESRNWHEWYDLVHSPSSSAAGASSSSPSNDSNCPTAAQVTKTFTIDAVQQFVDANTGRGLSLASVTPGTPDTKLSWTVFNDSRLMMPSTPLLLNAYLNTLNVSKNTAPTRRRLSSSALDVSMEQTQKLSSGRKSHFWDQYEIIYPHAGPGINIAVPKKDIQVFSNVKMSTMVAEMPAMDPALRPLCIELGDVVEVVVQAYASASGGCDLHPWHLHGHSFWLVSRGAGMYDPSSAAANAFDHPLRQDTVSGYPSNHSETRGQSSPKGAWRDPCGWFVIRFRADNPGMWLFHCHIGWHMEMGMALVFDESSELVPPPPSDYGMCGAAAELGSLSDFAQENVRVVTNTSTTTLTMGANNANFMRASVFQMLVSFVVLLGVVASVALFFVYLSRRKMRDMFVSLDNAQLKYSTSTSNPLSRHVVHEGIGELESGGDGASVQMVAVGGNDSSHSAQRDNSRQSTGRATGSTRLNPVTGHTHSHSSADHAREGELSYADSVDRDQFEEISFVAAARHALQKHKHRISPHSRNDYVGFGDNDEGEHSAVQAHSGRASQAFRTVKQSLAWRTQQSTRK